MMKYLLIAICLFSTLSGCRFVEEDYIRNHSSVHYGEPHRHHRHEGSSVNYGAPSPRSGVQYGAPAPRSDVQYGAPRG